MEGVLKKWTNILSGWKKRYFWIDGPLLRYSAKRGSKEKGYINLKSTIIVHNPIKPRHISFQTGMTLLKVKAKTPEVIFQWLQAIEEVKTVHSDGPVKEPLSSLPPAPELPQMLELIQAHLKKLWRVERQMEGWTENPTEPTEFIKMAKTFTGMALDALNALEDGYQKDRLVIDIPEEGQVLATLRDADEIVEYNNSEHAEELFYDAGEESVRVIAEEPVPYRLCLPVLRNPNQKINVWKIIKDTIGMDLSKISVPVYFNEPLSMLQRFTEELTYNELLVRAASSRNSLYRLALVACFAVSGYATTDLRLMKPFNPILGETFELQRDDFKLVSEQVSHHPPVSAMHCEHPKYIFHGSTLVKSNFKGTYMKMKPRGKLNLHFPKRRDHYQWEKPSTTVHNLIIGDMYIDNHGTFTIQNLTKGEKAEVVMKKKGWFSKKKDDNVFVKVFDENGKVAYTAKGRWNTGMTITDTETGEELAGFSLYPHPENYEHNYHFSEFALQLNIPPEEYPGLVSTDSRHRPDQRALENGDVAFATKEKQRLEEKQRSIRKEREKAKVEYSPRWFELVDGEWQFRGGYWERSSHHEDVLDIF